MQAFVFKPQKVREVLKKAIKERMEGQVYDPVKGSQVHIVKCVAQSILCPGSWLAPTVVTFNCYLQADFIRVTLQQAKQLAEDLREYVKALGFDRHKLIIQVLFNRKSLCSSGDLI